MDGAKYQVIALLLSLGASSMCSFLSIWIVFAMIGEVNRKRDDLSQLSFFRFSWIRVLREYQELYPKGRYILPLKVAVVASAISSFVFIYVLFGILPRYAVPSR